MITTDDEGESKTSLNSPSTEDLGSPSGNRVKFNKICIREYQRCLGDNPAVSSGPALSLSWNYNQETEMLTVDKYESERGERRLRYELIVPRHLREQILKMECGVSRTEIASCIREINKIKAGRRQTTNNLNFAGVEEKAERLKRTFGKIVGLRKSNDKNMQILWEQAKTQDPEDSFKKARPDTPKHTPRHTPRKK